METGVLAFLSHVKKECEAYEVQLCIRKGKYVVLNKKNQCSGYFDPEEGKERLVVASNRKDFLSILVHEYAHLTQWADNCYEWYNYGESYNLVDEWLGGEDVHNIGRHLKRAMLIELDNEKRSVALIKKFKLPIDIDDYIRKANSYMFFWLYLKYTRSWSKASNSPYNNKKIISKMPKRFLKEYVMTERIKQLYFNEGI
jgi:hypothetical protein